MRPFPFLSTALLAVCASAQFTPGNLVVLRVGDGVAALSNASTAMFLDEYSTSGALVQSVAMPTVAAGTNLPVTCSGTATSEGNLQLSENGLWLTFGGYNAAPGVASIAATASATYPRVIARVDMNGVVDTSTSTTSFTGGNIRSVATADGVNFYAGGSNSALQYLPLGATVSTALTTAPTNMRTVQTYGGNLYCSSASGSYLSISQIGTGLPNTAGTTVTALPGIPNVSGLSHYDFWFADANTLYVADDRALVSNGGILKYALVSGAWTLQYTLSTGLTASCRGLTGVNNGGVVTLFATTATTAVNSLVTVTDTGVASPFTVIATAPAATVWRGVRLLTASPYVTRFPMACGGVTIGTSGTAAIGTTFTTTVGNTTGLPFLGYGLSIGATPICANCTMGHEWSVALFSPGGAGVFGIPNDTGFLGLLIGIQGADAGVSTGCATLPVALTDTMVIQLH